MSKGEIEELKLKVNEENINSILAFVNKEFIENPGNVDAIELGNYKKLIHFLVNNLIVINDLEADILLFKSAKINNMVSSVLPILRKNEMEINESLAEVFKVYEFNHESSLEFDDNNETKSNDEQNNDENSDRVDLYSRFTKNDIDLIKLYFLEIKDFAVLTREEEQELFKAARLGDEDARTKLINHNLKLVISVAKRYTNMGVSFQDLIQEGNIGLMTAFDKFDPNKGYKFSTYALCWIKQKITRFISENGRTIRVPVYAYELMKKINRIEKRYILEEERKPTAQELATELKKPVEKIYEILRLTQDVLSLDTPYGETEDSESTLGAIIASEENFTEDLFNSMKLEEFKKIFAETKCINDRAKQVLLLRSGAYDRRVYTLEEIGKMFGLTRERIRQLELNALRKLAKDPDMRIFAATHNVTDIPCDSAYLEELQRIQSMRKERLEQEKRKQENTNQQINKVNVKNDRPVNPYRTEIRSYSGQSTLRLGKIKRSLY